MLKPKHSRTDKYRISFLMTMVMGVVEVNTGLLNWNWNLGEVRRNDELFKEL